MSKRWHSNYDNLNQDNSKLSDQLLRANKQCKWKKSDINRLLWSPKGIPKIPQLQSWTCVTTSNARKKKHWLEMTFYLLRWVLNIFSFLFTKFSPLYRKRNYKYNYSVMYSPLFAISCHISRKSFDKFWIKFCIFRCEYLSMNS